MSKRLTVVGWSIKVVYEDGTTENITDVPNFVANPIDEWLEETRNEFFPIDDWNEGKKINSQDKYRPLVTIALRNLKKGGQQ